MSLSKKDNIIVDCIRAILSEVDVDDVDAVKLAIFDEIEQYEIENYEEDRSVLNLHFFIGASEMRSDSGHPGIPAMVSFTTGGDELKSLIDRVLIGDDSIQVCWPVRISELTIGPHDNEHEDHKSILSEVDLMLSCERICTDENCNKHYDDENDPRSGRYVGEK